MDEPGRTNAPIAVATIAGSEALRNVLAASFARSPGLRPGGSFARVEDVVNVIKAGAQQVDVALGFTPPRDSIDLLKWRELHDAGTALLFFSTYPDERHTLRSAMAGAAGVIPRLVRIPEIASSIIEVASGGRLLSPMVGAWLQQLRHGNWLLDLSEGEQAVMGAVLEGLRTADISERLSCSRDDVLAVLAEVSDRLRP